jgi:signal transduction histidine kinase
MNGLMQQLRIGTSPVENPRHVDLDAVVRRACAVKSACAVKIVLDSSAAFIIDGHEDRLERVIGHLLQNAIDASSSGAVVRVSLVGEAQSAVITVSDDGVGMTPEFVRDSLFKPFQTTKPAGMGIGVYESAQYVAVLGGQITVDSRAGVGTDVRVRFPLVPSSPATPRVVNEAAA